MSFTEADKSLQVTQGLIPGRRDEDVAPIQPSSAPHPPSDLTPVRSMGPEPCPAPPISHAQVLGIIPRPPSPLMPSQNI